LVAAAIRVATPRIAERKRSEIPSPFLDFSTACSQEICTLRRGGFAELGSADLNSPALATGAASAPVGESKGLQGDRSEL
jgi:hypothetical protein